MATGIGIQANGQRLVVDISNSNGRPTAFTNSALTVAAVFPQTITADQFFYWRSNTETYTVSVKDSAGDELYGAVAQGYHGGGWIAPTPTTAQVAKVRPASYTTTLRNALTSLTAGDMVYDTTLHYNVTWDGAAWRNQAGTSV